jgi:hypothetical protein
MTTTLFYKNTDLSEGYSQITKGFTSSFFDYYDVKNSNVRIKHQVINGTDSFSVEETQYEYKGCWVGTQVNYGKFDNFDDAVTRALPIDSVPSYPCAV